MSVVDRRPMIFEQDPSAPVFENDDGFWLHAAFGNRVRQVIASPDETAVARDLLSRIFGAGNVQGG